MSCGHDVTALIGETFRLDITYKDSLGVPIDISFMTATWTVNAVSYASPSNEVTIGPGTGEVHLLLTTTQVSVLGSGVYDYQVVLTDPTADPGEGDKILLEGLMQVE